MKSWETIHLRQGKPYARTIGDLDLRVTMDGNRWNVGHRHRIPGSAAGGYTMTRIHHHSPASSLEITPLMPDRPVVVDFENPVRIVTGHTVCFFVPIPLWVGLADKRDTDVILMDLPSVVLSNTWFGDHYSGILSYSLKTHPVVTPDGWTPSHNEALCPVEVRMESPEIFSFRKVCLFAQYLTVYRRDDIFWTNGVVVEYPGESSMKISLAERKPSADDGFIQVTGPRFRADMNILEKSMTLLRRYTGL